MDKEKGLSHFPRIMESKTTWHKQWCCFVIVTYTDIQWNTLFYMLSRQIIPYIITSGGTTKKINKDQNIVLLLQRTLLVIPTVLELRLKGVDW